MPKYMMTIKKIKYDDLSELMEILLDVFICLFSVLYIF